MRRYHSIHQLVLLAALGLLCCSTERVDDGGDPTPTPPAAADLRYPVVESDYMPSRQQTGDMIPDFSRVGYRWATGPSRTSPWSKLSRRHPTEAMPRP